MHNKNNQRKELVDEIANYTNYDNDISKESNSIVDSLNLLGSRVLEPQGILNSHKVLNRNKSTQNKNSTLTVK